MTIFAYIAAFFALPAAVLYGGQYAVASGVPLLLCFIAGGIIAACFSWHCAMRFTAGRNW